MSSKSLFARNTSSPFFIEYCEGRNIDVRAIAADLGKQLLPGSGIHYDDFNLVCTFFERLSQHSGDPHFGLHWALAQPDDLHHAGPIMHLANQVTTYRGMLNIAMDYLKTFSNGFIFSFEENKETGLGVFRCDVHPMAAPCRQYLEHNLAVAAQVAIKINPDARLAFATFQHDGNPNDPVYKKAFGVPVKFNAPENSVTAEMEFVKSKTIDASKLIRRAAQKYLNYQLRSAGRPPENMTVTIAGILPGLMGVQKTNMPAVAELLQVSPKKLRRLLADEGTNFSSILDDTRKSMSLRYLIDFNMSLKQIALILDYSSQETFIQAFKRWHDCKPSEYKARHRNGAKP